MPEDVRLAHSKKQQAVKIAGERRSREVILETRETGVLDQSVREAQVFRSATLDFVVGGGLVDDGLAVGAYSPLSDTVGPLAVREEDPSLPRALAAAPKRHPSMNPISNHCIAAPLTIEPHRLARSKRYYVLADS